MFSTDEAAVDRRLPMMVERPPRPASLDGNHEFELAQGWYRLLLYSEGYRETWTPKFEVLEGRTTSFGMAMVKASTGPPM